MPNPNTQPQESNSIVSQVAERVRTSDNVLVALSKDPSVDELSAALGLTFILDKMGKHATAIFSGAVPNAIEFLEPEKTFETNTNSLQDFIIALDKEKADHLRYKIDGDYVKVFITPYKTTIDEGDMEFSHGDYNVDLVIALNVTSSDDLDSALTEYGRIMHDASSINISANVPGNFGDLEWGDPAASSVSEMIFELSQNIKEKGKENIDKSTATALLAGIVAATNRFSNERTTPETMAIASKLMTYGADQQLISSSIPVDILTSDIVDATEDAKEEPNDDLGDIIASDTSKSNTELESEPEPEPKPEEPIDPTNLAIDHAKDGARGKKEKKEPLPVPTSASEPEKLPQAEPATNEPEQKNKESDSDSTRVDRESDSKLEPEPSAAESSAEESQPVGAVDMPPLTSEASSVPTSEPEAPIKEALNPKQSTEVPREESVSLPDTKTTDNTSNEPPITPIAPAEPEPQIELSANPVISTPEEQASATAELEQLVAPNSTNDTGDSVINELQDASVHVKKNLIPPSEALEPPKVPKDYAAMMASELSEESQATPAAPNVGEPEPLIAPVPDNMPVLDTSPEPSAPPKPASSESDSAEVSQASTDSDVVENEYVDPPLPMPDANTILPPPPIPFDPSSAPATVEDAPATAPIEAPSAQDYVNQLQQDIANLEDSNSGNNPAVPNVSMPPVNENVINNTTNTVRGGVMPDQVYPVDPSAFQIPNM